MKSIETLANRVMTRAAGAAEPVVIDGLRRAAQEFCESTRLWRYTDEFASTTDIEGDLLCAPEGAEIVEIESARFGERVLKPASLVWLDEVHPGWRSMSGDQADWITQTAPDSVCLVPRASGALSITLTLKPSDDAELVPDWLVDKHSRTLVDGALAEVLMTPGQDYSNPSLAAVHSQRFQATLDRLSSQGYQGQQRAAVRSRGHFF